MRKANIVVVVAMLVTGCANSNPQVSIQHQLAGKNKTERVAVLTAECRELFNTSHVGPASNRKYGNIQFRRHEADMKKVCLAMSGAAQGNTAGASAQQLLEKCLDEKVIGGRAYPHRNKAHIERKTEVCRAFYAEMHK
jgi:hypothetical protein